MQEVLQHNITLLSAIGTCLDKNLIFAAYRLPGKHDFVLVVQKDRQVEELQDLFPAYPARGFLICPFSRESGEKAFLIRPDSVFRGNAGSQAMDEINRLPGLVPPKFDAPDIIETQKETYLGQVENIIDRIGKGEFEKVVLSRVKTVKGNFRQKLPQVFDKLCKTYAEAFVYLFCVNGNCWTGATPEPFICSSDDSMITVSLAGTRPYQKANMDIRNWNRKELLEQEFVTRHIEKVLVDFHVKGYRKNGPYVSRAGNLSHLRTDFVFPLATAGKQLPLLVNALHPTPAVCGMASGKVMEYIQSAEQHSRGYYAGFLGPVGMDENLKLFVNLRCMKVLPDRLVLFVGGGITLDSVPVEEWEETEIKADTLLTVLHQIH